MEDELRRAVIPIDVAVALIDLEDLTVVAVSDRALEGLPPGIGGVGTPVLDVLCPEERPAAALAFGALASGALDFYRAHRRLPGPGRTEGFSAQWVRAVSFSGRRFAFVELSAQPAGVAGPLAVQLGWECAVVALGSANDKWIIRTMSDQITELLGVPATSLLGTTLQVPHEVREVGDAGTFGAGSSVAYGISLLDSEARPVELCCVVFATDVRSTRCFALVPDPGAALSTRLAAAEVVHEHLYLAASEDLASRIVEHASRLPPALIPRMGQLTSRQQQVLDQLLGGARVRMIADALFLSESAVRGHLSSIFDVFGVHSQADLIALFVGHSASP